MNMKKRLIYSLLVIMLVSSCKKEAAPFGGVVPGVREHDTLAKYQSILTGAPYGWKGLVMMNILFVYRGYGESGSNSKDA